MSASFPIRITFSEATDILRRVASSARLGSERRPLSRCLDRILAQDVVAPIDLPPFDNSAMDGFAIHSADTHAPGPASFEIVGDQFAGAPIDVLASSGCCVRITTGAPLPRGADAVIVKEVAHVLGTTMTSEARAEPGGNVRFRGEDVRCGETVLRTGQVMTPAALSLAAALGQHELEVFKRPTVAVFTTGDELKSPGMDLLPGELYDSNRVLLQTLLIADGFEPVAWPLLPDDPARLEAALRDAAFSFDVVITCGGVSAGERDFLPRLLADIGDVYFWKVMMRPGMPVLTGRLGSAHVLCLPGNPVSVFATYLTLVRGFLDGLQSRAQPRPKRFAKLVCPISKSHARLEFARARLECDVDGQWRVERNPADGSHRLRAVADSNALLVLPEGVGQWAAGAVLEVLPLGTC